ncbi:hypothetical protein MNBD_GAMMA26-1768 [hydrothermal vent metagenome]|uniref:TRASH domain-containing protein n=1 Tax=hydrothermal vent metagenome TaxID=652676 RepID=A0A3B1BX02_9ZZZZ
MTEEIINICPVCDMIGEFNTHTLQHNKKTLHFCSEQCKETLVAHPTLYLGKADRGKDIKRRTLHMAEPLDAETTKQVISCLSAMMGVKEVAVDGEKVHITYDLLLVTEKAIEKALADAELPLSQGWLERLHRAWVQGNEKTELGNLVAKPLPGCHQMPPKS